MEFVRGLILLNHVRTTTSAVLDKLHEVSGDPKVGIMVETYVYPDDIARAVVPLPMA